MFKKISPKLLLSILIFFSFVTIGRAQTSADALRLIWENTDNPDSIRFQAIEDFCKTYTTAQPDSVFPVIDYHLEYAKQTGNQEEMAKALNSRSFAYYIKGDAKHSMMSLKESISIFEQLNKPLSLASVYGNMGNIYGAENQPQEALHYFYKTLKIFKDENKKPSEARMLFNMGLVFSGIDCYDLALEYFKESIDIYQSLGIEDKTGPILASIGEVFYEQKKYKEAIEQCEKAIDILLKSNNNFAASECYFVMAASNKKLGNDEMARHYIDKSLEIDHQINNNAKLIEHLTFDAELFYKHDLDKATQKAESLLERVEMSTANGLKVGVYELLYRCYKAQNKYDLSLEMHEKQVLYSDSVQFQQNRTTIIRDAVQKEFEAKLDQNNIENEKLQNQLKVKHKKRTYWIASVFLLLTSMIGLYSRSLIKANHKERNALLIEIDKLKNIDVSLVAQTQKFQLDRSKIETYIKRKINETDWKVLNILLDDPVIPNKEIAQKAFMSVDGIGSSLRRMYEYFNIKESKYKKISLLMLAIKLSTK